jgi:uncharacterized protein YjbI with pentapeptide repeats
MANREHLAKLKEGVETWNQWKKERKLGPINIFHPLEIHEDPQFVAARLRFADLRAANLRGASLSRADLTWVDLSNANLVGADLRYAELGGASIRAANLSGANLNSAKMSMADLRTSNLSEAQLLWADLTSARLDEADLSGADLDGADLGSASFRRANLVGTNLSSTSLENTDFGGATLRDCNVYGISAWNVGLTATNQSNLTITRSDEPAIQVDNLEIAQFVYLLLNNEKIREVIDTITSKVVLILGRFTPSRKVILDAIREELRKRDYVPVLFDFEKPSSRDITETIRILAAMARFVIADITDAKSIPQELMAIVPNLPSVPVQPLLLESQHEYGMFEHFRRYPWVLPPVLYKNVRGLLASLEARVIAPAETKASKQTS